MNNLNEVLICINVRYVDYMTIIHDALPGLHVINVVYLSQHSQCEKSRGCFQEILKHVYQVSAITAWISVL